MDIEEFNRQQHERNFPPAQEWAQVQGALYQPPPTTRQGGLISINGVDRSGSEVAIWMDVPNAMYLLSMLATLQAEEKLPVPRGQPGPSKP